MTATSAYVLTERDKLIAALALACRCMNCAEIEYLIQLAQQLNAIHSPSDRAP